MKSVQKLIESFLTNERSVDIWKWYNHNILYSKIIFLWETFIEHTFQSRICFVACQLIVVMLHFKFNCLRPIHSPKRQLRTIFCLYSVHLNKCHSRNIRFSVIFYFFSFWCLHQWVLWSELSLSLSQSSVKFIFLNFVVVVLCICVYFKVRKDNKEKQHKIFAETIRDFWKSNRIIETAIYFF